MNTSAAIANRFLRLASEKGETLTPMQLLKLVYIAHGWALGLYSRPLIRDEIQAWQYGPVIPDLYQKIRRFRSNPVEGEIDDSGADALSSKENNLIEQVYDIYGRWSGPALSRLTHAKGTPWDKTYEPGAFGVVIPDDIIEDHYANLAAQRNA